MIGPVKPAASSHSNAAHVVDVYVGGNQRLDGTDVKVDVLALPTVACLLPLEQAAIHQQAVVGVDVQLVAGAGDAGSGAMVLYIGLCWHGPLPFW